MNMRWDAIWCIFRHNFEKCSCVYTGLVASGWFFWCSYLYTVMTTTFSGGAGGGGSWAFWGGSFYLSNTLHRTLISYEWPIRVFHDGKKHFGEQTFDDKCFRHGNIRLNIRRMPEWVERVVHLERLNFNLKFKNCNLVGGYLRVRFC